MGLDVDTDDVLIIDGLTKNFRLPGWRIAVRSIAIIFHNIMRSIY